MAQTTAYEQSFDFPAGTAAQRPVTSSSSTSLKTEYTGAVRFNTDSDTLEYFNGEEWVGIGLLDGSSQANAAPSAAYIKTVTGTTTTGLYWIKTADMAVGIEVYCDMSYDGGGWMMLSYGYTDGGDRTGNARALPNLNHDGSVYSYSPASRASGHGMLPSPNSQKSAVLIAQASSTFLMAMGNNPSSGGIDSHSYVYKFTIPNPSAVTFNNHSYAYNGNMNISTITVNALKGDSGNYTRYTITQALGVSWGDSYPIGYGATSSSNPKSVSPIPDGPYFPSVHGGSSPGRGGGWIASPDLGVNGYVSGNQYESFEGWYRPSGRGYSGGGTIWVK